MMSWGGGGEEAGAVGGGNWLFVGLFPSFFPSLQLPTESTEYNILCIHGHSNQRIYPTGHIQFGDKHFHRHTGAPCSEDITKVTKVETRDYPILAKCKFPLISTSSN